MRPPFPNRASLSFGPYLVTASSAGVFDQTKNESGVMKNPINVPAIRHDIAVARIPSHRNITTLQDVISSKTSLTSLTELIRKGGIRDSDKSTYFRQLLDVLSFCHRLGVYHRDLQPELLFVDKEGCLKVTGFGSDRVSRSVYSAPEIIKGDEQRGEKIDAWSCGIVLHFLVTSSMPDPAQLHRGEFEFSTEAGGLITQLLALDPSKRCSMLDASRHPWLVSKENEAKLRNEDVDFKELINAALPGRTDSVVQIFADKLARLDIERREDLALLASLFKSPGRLAEWLEEKSRLPAFASLRLARYIFKY